MTVWRYTAFPVAEPGQRREGELSAQTAELARASLRRVGLQVVRIRPAKQNLIPAGALRWPAARQALDQYLAQRRSPVKSELFDSAATMLEAGIPLLEALSALVEAKAGRASASRTMLVQLRDAVRSGASLDDAMREHASWFDPAEVAIVEAGRHSGELATVLRALASRHGRADALRQRLIGALAYPSVIACVGVSVVIFLSVKTLPELAAILKGADIEVPALTRSIMTIGQGLVGYGWLAIPLAVVTAVLVLAWRSRRSSRPSARTWAPRLVRRMQVGRLLLALTELTRAGVPLVEALRVTEPTLRGWGSLHLRRVVTDAADELERGGTIGGALRDERWFDGEFRRLAAVAETAGELDEVFGRIGERYERRSERSISRLATLLEPAVIVFLAVLVGLVVLGAVLPLVRLQEVL